MTTDECLNDGAYVLGSLSPTERQTFERHLATCEKCQVAVRRLAGLPGLLAMVGPETLSDSVAEPVVPATLLPALLNRVRSEHRRRRWLVAGTSALAAACAALLVIVLVVRPSGTPAAVSPPNAVVTLQPQVTAPMSVTVALVDKQWGTSITINCKYGVDHDPGMPYELFVIDKSAQGHDVGSWAAVSGNSSTVTAATALHRAEIAGFEVRLPNGLVVLKAAV